MSTVANVHPGAPAWYALFTRSRQEKIAAKTLESLEIAHLLPLIEEERRWTDRRKTIRTPLFPGYLFVRISIASDVLLRVRKVPGVVDFVGNLRGPVAIAQNEIENIQIVLSRGTGCSPHPPLAVGERVRVVRGAFAGVQGVFVRYGAVSRVVVSVEIIQRAISVEVAAADVEPVSQPAAGRLCA